jgi:hypothetical protein
MVSMTILEILIQTIIDWVRDIFAGILGRRTEEFFGKYIKRRRRRKKLLRRKDGGRAGTVSRSGRK